MSQWLIEAGLYVGLALLAFALFHSPRPWLRRAGNILLIGASGLALWFWTSSLWWVALGVSLWFLVPMIQAAWLSRKLTFAVKRKLSQGSIREEDFPGINQLTYQLKQFDFKLEGEYWLKPSPLKQGYRLFSDLENSLYAALAVIRFGGASLIYMIFATPARNKAVWLTWDYPLAYGLRMPPHIMLHRCLEANSVKELCEQHRKFLSINKVKPAKAKSAKNFFEKLFAATIDHNLHAGILGQSPRQEEKISYTWRGTAFVAWQVLCEVVKG